jgi:hypothetical protein
VSNLVGEILRGEIVRVQNIRELYLTIPNGHIAANGLMAPALQRARAALESGDPIAMMECLTDLRGFEE